MSGNLNIPSDMPTEHTNMIREKYDEFLKDREERKESQRQQEQKQEYPRPPKGISPKDLGLKRDKKLSKVELTDQVPLSAGAYWFGTQSDIPDSRGKSKVVSASLKDGADPRRLVKVKSFYLDVDCVTNTQFQDFVSATGYATEAELFGWSFVLDSLASKDVVAEVDGETGYGRVKDAQHWMAVKGATWATPMGSDSEALPSMPVVHVSYRDSEEYCAWAVGPFGPKRLPTEHEWEYAARGGLQNQSYPWGTYESQRMNIWEGTFPEGNNLEDGYHGLAPVKSYPPQTPSGLYNLLGNVWEWALEGNGEKRRDQGRSSVKPLAENQRVLRGGSFVDSLDGSFNHAVFVSTRQINSADSAASNIGFRCASSGVPESESESDSLARAPSAGGSTSGVGSSDL